MYNTLIFSTEVWGMAFLDSIRAPKQQLPAGRRVFHTVAVLLLGVALGLFSKYLDYRQGQLPSLLMALDETFDLHNFLGRFAFWMAIAVGLAVFSRSPWRAALHVFLFFAGMVASYYGYSKLVAGFLPLRYAMIWAGFTALSPVLAFVCWYAKGTGRISFGLSCLISAVFFNMTFVYGWGYGELRSVLEGIVCICVLVMLKRSTAKETALLLALGLVLAPVLKMIVPYPFQVW